MFERFEKLSVLYAHRCMEPVWQACPDWENDPWASLRLFLLGYAFERQGRPPDFAPAAADAIDKVRSKRLDETAAKAVWEEFSQALGGLKLNHANNPLCPRGVGYSRTYLGDKRSNIVRKMSVLELVAERLEGQCLIPWARGLIEAEETRKAHAQLRAVNGISNKIASFFLRDVGFKSGLAPANDRQLLQPIDGWVRFVTRTMSGKELDDAACAEYIVQNSAQPERANQGMWYFCVHVAGSAAYRVRHALADEALFRRFVAEHLARLRRDAEAAIQFERERSDCT